MWPSLRNILNNKRNGTERNETKTYTINIKTHTENTPQNKQTTQCKTKRRLPVGLRIHFCCLTHCLNVSTEPNLSLGSSCSSLTAFCKLWSSNIHLYSSKPSIGCKYTRDIYDKYNVQWTVKSVKSRNQTIECHMNTFFTVPDLDHKCSSLCAKELSLLLNLDTIGYVWKEHYYRLPLNVGRYYKMFILFIMSSIAVLYGVNVPHWKIV